MDNALASQLTGLVSGELNTQPDPNFGMTSGPGVQTSSILREPPDPAVQRAALLSFWNDRVLRAREHWDKKAFKKMRRDRQISAGKQWPEYVTDNLVDEKGERYVANIVLRHIHQRTATIYGKNPKIVARRKNRLLATLWDGTFQSLKQAMQSVSMPDPLTGMPDPNAMAVIMDATKVLQTTQQLDKIAKTLELMFEHDLSEQAVPFKVQMKSTVRRTLTTGVGYVKLGYQRTMKKPPEIEARIADMSQQLATIEQLSADIADNEVAPDSKEAESLRLSINAMRDTQDILVREGLLVSYPDSTSIIPDINMKQLRGFVGADYVAEEFYLSRAQIEQIYKKDVGKSGAGSRFYCEQQDGVFKSSEGRVGDGAAKDTDYFCVWQIYNKSDGLVYTICDGYKEFLEEPSTPDVYMERFYPWFVLVFNEVDDPENVFPPSDVSLMYDMQLEINRSRQGLREHRRANRPRTIVRTGALEDDDKAAIENCEANAVVELNGLQPQEKIEDVLQVWKGPQIDPAIYDTNPAYEDILRVMGQQEANLGGTSGATATEVATAEGSRASSVSSNVDDLDEFLVEFARAGGQIILKETSPATVRQVVGPGAVWPDLRRDEIAKEIYLDVEAASTGRPNKAQEIQNAQQLVPLLLQVPGINPEWVARELIRRLDDRLDLTDAFAADMPSIMMMNRLSQMAPAQGGNDPNAQGAQGAANNENPAAPQVNAAPRPANQNSMPQPGSVAA